MPGVAFFVCGTPSNHRGFEFVELGPERVPGTPEAYLDKAPSDAVECHRIESILIAGQRHVEYSRVLRINPNDAEANRGAYVAVGCLIGQRVALHTVANCVDVVSELYGRVSGALTPERSFPVGFRLADLAHTGSPLDERTAYQCSPVLVADVVLQALNGEGSIDWANSRQLLLAPGEMLAADVSRYQLYSRQGLLGSLASIDHGAGGVQQMARQTEPARSLGRRAASGPALQGCGASSAKAEALKHLTEEMERSVDRDLSLGEAGTRDRRAGGRKRASKRRNRNEWRTNATAKTLLATLQDSVQLIGERPPGSVRSKIPGSRWASVSVLVIIGSVLVVLVGVAFQRYLLPELAHEAVPPASVVTEPEHQDGEQALEQPQNDIARERAALDASPDE
jgi:hypothetical protein